MSFNFTKNYEMVTLYAILLFLYLSFESFLSIFENVQEISEMKDFWQSSACPPPTPMSKRNCFFDTIIYGYVLWCNGCQHGMRNQRT